MLSIVIGSRSRTRPRTSSRIWAASLLAITSCTASAPAESPVLIGDVVLALSRSTANRSMRQIRGGLQYRSPGDFPGTGVPPIGAWSDPNAVFLQSVKFDNSGGLRKNARGNLLAMNFGSTATGGTLFNLSTDGSNRIQGPLFTFGATATGQPVPQRISGLAISPDNAHIAGAYFESGRLFVMDYNAGSSVGTGAGASVSTLQSSAQFNQVQHTFGCAFLDNDTLVTAYSVSDGAITIATADFNPSTNQLLPPVVRATLPRFVNSGNSRYTALAYEPTIAPYILVYHSLFAGATENRLSVIDPSNWAVLRTIDLSMTVGTSREIAIGPDRHAYLGQFVNDSQNTVYVDVLNLDRDADGDVDASDAGLLTDNSSVDHARRALPNQSLDEGSSFTGLDVALSAPQGTPAGPLLGACSLVGASCVSQVSAAGCQQLGGVYLGDGSTCAGPQPLGACCRAPSDCVIATSSGCSGDFLGIGTTCGPSSCPNPQGVCCGRARCQPSLMSECAGEGRRFIAGPSACNTPDNFASPCCSSDYDASGSLGVQDIFDFLRTWFNGAFPDADFNQDSRISPEDVWTFLQAWFTAC